MESNNGERKGGFTQSRGPYLHCVFSWCIFAPNFLKLKQFQCQVSPCKSYASTGRGCKMSHRKLAKRAAVACAAFLARYSISCATFCVPTRYMFSKLIRNLHCSLILHGICNASYSHPLTRQLKLPPLVPNKTHWFSWTPLVQKASRLYSVKMSSKSSVWPHLKPSSRF